MPTTTKMQGAVCMTVSIGQHTQAFQTVLGMRRSTWCQAQAPVKPAGLVLSLLFWCTAQASFECACTALPGI